MGWTVDGRTHAGNPGRVEANLWVWFLHYPFWGVTLAAMVVVSALFALAFHRGFLVLAVLLALYNLRYWVSVKEWARDGDANAGLIVSTDPVLYAAGTDLGKGAGSFPVVKILEKRFRPGGQEPAVGTRITTIALYEGALHDGSPHWWGFNPRPVDCATRDPVQLERSLRSVPPEHWTELKRHLEQVPRPLRPGLYAVDQQSTAWSEVRTAAKLIDSPTGSPDVDTFGVRLAVASVTGALGLVALVSLAGRTEQGAGGEPRPAVAERVEEATPEPARPAESEEAAPARPSQPARTMPEENSIGRQVRAVYEDAASADAEARLRAVRSWQERRWDEVPEGRVQMVQALAARPDPLAEGAEVTLVAERLRDRPPPLGEALRCLEVARAPAALRRAVLLGLRDRELTASERQRLAQELARIQDTEDLLIEEVLVRQGRPRPGVLQRLLQARGLEWARSAEGAALLAVAGTLTEIAPVLQDARPELRSFGCDLAVGASVVKDARPALTLLLPLLRDQEPLVRQAAAAAAGRVGDSAASWGLARALMNERDPATLGALRSALLALPREATIAQLTRLRGQTAASDRLAAQHAARVVDETPRALVVLLDGLEDAAPAVRLDALQGLLERVKSREAREVMATRRAVIRALARDPSDPKAQALAFDLDRALLLD